VAVCHLFRVRLLCEPAADVARRWMNLGPRVSTQKRGCLCLVLGVWGGKGGATMSAGKILIYTRGGEQGRFGVWGGG